MGLVGCQRLPPPRRPVAARSRRRVSRASRRDPAVGDGGRRPARERRAEGGHAGAPASGPRRGRVRDVDGPHLSTLLLRRHRGAGGPRPRPRRDAPSPRRPHAQREQPHPGGGARDGRGGPRVGLPDPHLASQAGGTKQLGPRGRGAGPRRARPGGRPSPHGRSIPVCSREHPAGSHPPSLGPRRGNRGDARSPARRRRAGPDEGGDGRGRSRGLGQLLELERTGGDRRGGHSVRPAPGVAGEEPGGDGPGPGPGSVRSRLRPAARGTDGRGHDLVLPGRGGRRAHLPAAVGQRVHRRAARRPAAPAGVRHLPPHPRPLRAGEGPREPRRSGAKAHVASRPRVRLRGMRPRAPGLSGEPRGLRRRDRGRPWHFRGAGAVSRRHPRRAGRRRAGRE